MTNFLLMMAEEITPVTPAEICERLTPVWTVIGYAIFLIKVLVPLLLIITGMISLAKAVMSEKEDEIQATKNILIKKIIVGVAVFLVIQVTGVIMNVVANDKSYQKCAVCSFKPFTGDCYVVPRTKGGTYNPSTIDPSEKETNAGSAIYYSGSGSGYFNAASGSSSQVIKSSPLIANKDYWNESKYESKKITIPESSACRQNGTCNETYQEDGMARVVDGVFYYSHNTSYNGKEDGIGDGLEGLNITFYNRLQAFFAAAKAANPDYDLGVITGAGDGYRDYETQKYYYCCYKGKYLNSKNTATGATCTSQGCNSGNEASFPGTSNHGWGLAADLYLRKNGSKSKEVIRWAHIHAEEYGLAFTVKSEDWHIEPLYVCDISNSGSAPYNKSNCLKATNYICNEDASSYPQYQVGSNSKGTYCNP